MRKGWRVEDCEVNGALDLFLDLIARDIATHPKRLKVTDHVLIAQVHSLVRDAEIDITEPLLPEDEE